MIKKCIADNIIDVLPIDDILNDYIQTFDGPVSKKEPLEQDSGKKISDELAKEGYYDKEDHSFFSDSDIETEDDDTEDAAAEESETDDEETEDAEDTEDTEDTEEKEKEPDVKPIKLSKSDLKELESAVAKPQKEVQFKKNK